MFYFPNLFADIIGTLQVMEKINEKDFDLETKLKP